MKRMVIFILLGMGIFFTESTCSQDVLMRSLARLLTVYPQISAITGDCVVWADGTSMELSHYNEWRTYFEKLNEPTLVDQLEQEEYIIGESGCTPTGDPGRIRYEPFFRKMYGDSPEEVEKNLERVVWMPRTFGQETYILYVTRINGVHEKIKLISDELDELVCLNPEYIRFLKRPGGTYCWRFIANTNRLSNHSFGMTLDINADQSQYWQWDLKAQGQIIQEDVELVYRNNVPWKIVEIFEKYGFIWGGKWYHYDTMHFEYRPELMMTNISEEAK